MSAAVFLVLVLATPPAAASRSVGFRSRKRRSWARAWHGRARDRLCLPDGYRQIFRLYVFGGSLRASGLWLRYTMLQNVILPFLGLCQGGGVGRKEGIKFCYLATLRVIDFLLTSPHLCSGASSLASRRIISASAMTGVSRPAYRDRGIDQASRPITARARSIHLVSNWMIGATCTLSDQKSRGRFCPQEEEGALTSFGGRKKKLLFYPMI